MSWSDNYGRAWTPSGLLPGRTAPRSDAPDFDRADRIGEFYGYLESRAFAELLIDCARRTGRFGRCWSGCCGRSIRVGSANDGADPERER